MAPAAEQASVLVYDRIAHNRRMTVVLAFTAVVSAIVPVAVAAIAVALFIPLVANCTPEVPWALGAGSGLLMLSLLAVLLWTLASEPMSKLLALMGARVPTKEESHARRLLENLSIGAGLPVPKFYVMDSCSPNACAAGMDPSNSAVVVTEGLLHLLDARELEGVLAHELSHIGNRDTRLNTVVAAIALFLRIPYLLHQDHQADQDARLRLAGLHNYNWAGVLTLPVRFYLFFVAPTMALLIQSAVSRSREYLADADAALLTRNPSGLMRALAKISGAGSAIAEASPSLAHLYFANPSAADAGAAGRSTDRLFDSHPPIAYRIELLAKFEEGVTESEIEIAVRAGQEFARTQVTVRPAVLSYPAGNELSVFTAGNPCGRAFRMGPDTAPVPVYDQPNPKSRVVAYVMSGELLVVFDDPGKMREILTHNHTFGYLPARARLERVDILPAEVFDSQ